nr:hypothetical protein [Gordonia sp. NB41Y]
MHRRGHGVLRRPVALAGPANRAGRLVADAVLRPAKARPMPAPVSPRSCGSAASPQR